MGIDDVRFRKSPAIGTTAPAKVIVEGKTTPNATVVVENKSQAVFAPTQSPDTFTTVTAGADGTFKAELPAAREGDQLKVRSVPGGGARGVLGVLSVRIANVEAIDGRPPVVRQQGLRLVAGKDGAFGFGQVCKSTAVGEPAQLLRMTNKRTNEAVTFTLDDEGRLPKDAKLEGKPGDVWQLATTDGTHNTSYTDGCGMLVAPSATSEPQPMSDHIGMAKVELKVPLFVNGGPSACAVKQGQIGDCWLVSAADAIATCAPQRLRDIMKDNGDGTVTVTFKKFDHDSDKYVDEKITVDKNVYARGTTPYYGQSTKGESWFPILEKAYAQWKGGYDGIRSGYPFEAFEAILGAEGKHFDLDVSSAEAVWRGLQKQTKSGEAMVAWSRVDTPALSFSNTGLCGDHAYAIVGAEDRDGERFVKMRNPWNSHNWCPGNSPMKSLADGMLEMSLENFMKYYAGYGAAPTS